MQIEHRNAFTIRYGHALLSVNQFSSRYGNSRCNEATK